MNIFEVLTQYAAKYNVINSRPFNETERAAVVAAEVVASEFGMSVCFHMISGTKTYIPVSRDSSCSVGDRVSLETSELLTLSREGSANINRVYVK